MSSDALPAEVLLAELARTLGLPNAQFNAQRVCRLLVDNNRAVDLERDLNGTVLTIYTALGRAGNPAVYRDLLAAAGSVGRETRGATFGLDEDCDEILLAGSLPVGNLTGRDLAAIVEAYVDVAARWAPRLLDVPGGSSTEAAGTWTRV